jgi:hypothetical protein
MTTAQAHGILNQLGTMIPEREPLKSETIRFRRRLRQLRFAFEVSLPVGSLKDEALATIADLERCFLPHWRRATDDRTAHRRHLLERIRRLGETLATTDLN